VSTFFCTKCWHEVSETATICPNCGDNIPERLAHRDYADKLIAALDHPEATTPIRTAWILGERHEKKAAPELSRLVRTSSDTFLVAIAVEALGKIGGPEALTTIHWAEDHPSSLVRIKAKRARQMAKDT
jgi:HEAT repeat protein